MSNRIKKISSVLFILLGLTPLLFAFVFILKQQSVRHRMKERLEEEMLHTLSIPDQEVKWMDDGKEIFVNGHMFDVKTIEHRDGITIVHGLYDDEETALNKVFNESWKKKRSQQNLVLAQLFNCLRSIYFSPDNEPDLIFDAQQHIYCSFSPRLESQVRLILTPPPQC